MKPELEHLRTQAATHKDLLSEKLALQRQLSDVHVELEHAKKEAQRALAKRRNTMHDLAHEDELEGVRKSATREKRAREKAEETIEELKVELEEQKKAAQRKTTTETRKAEQDAETEVRSEELSRELSQEKKEKAKAERALQQAQINWEAQKAVLDDKLNQFRTKLRSTKDKLKETETALAEAQVQAATTAKAVKTAEVKISKKRNATQMDPDATALGTPGDGPTNKRSRKVAGVGDKSTFSITPFLNRTMSVAPESPVEEEEEEKETAQGLRLTSVSEAERSPSAKPQVIKKKQPLQPVSASKSNIKKTAPPKKVKLPNLEMVVEEDENSQGQPKEPVLKPKQQKERAKVRKSLATFATFNLEPEVEKKKKRKLGGLGKTLFDEEDDVQKPMPGRGLFAGGRLGPLGGLGAATKGSFLIGGKKKGLLSTDDGFQFSPLKKDKKNMSFLK